MFIFHINYLCLSLYKCYCRPNKNDYLKSPHKCAFMLYSCLTNQLTRTLVQHFSSLEPGFGPPKNSESCPSANSKECTPKTPPTTTQTSCYNETHLVFYILLSHFLNSLRDETCLPQPGHMKYYLLCKC